jgi:pimeloyl-ACP methyl ester carboxylesterase
MNPILQQTSASATKRGLLDRPGARVYYEATGSGPAIVFAHGIGSNHMTWWQQVAHFSDRYTCVTFSHRGYPPGSDIGVPDPTQFAGDLAALIEHLQLPDVRLVGQSMGGLTAIEYILNHPQHKVRALVLTSTAGTLQRNLLPGLDQQRYAQWEKNAAAARADLQRRGIAPPAGERMAREQPGMHFLYRSIANASGSFDREALRARTDVMRTRSPDVLRGFTMPTLLITGAEDVVFAPFVADAMAPLLPDGKLEQVRDAGHSVYFQRADIFNHLIGRFFDCVN